MDSVVHGVARSWTQLSEYKNDILSIDSWKVNAMLVNDST